MYLSLLSKDNKELFLDLILIIAKVDRNFSDEEKGVINSYCNEMGITYRDEKKYSSVEELINVIDESTSMKEKRIFIFEAIGLAMADGDFDGDERKIILLASYVFALDESYVKECEVILTQYYDFQNKVNQLVLA